MFRKAFLCVALAIFCPAPAWADSPPVVSNVTASQRADGSMIVDIYYGLADFSPQPDPVLTQVLPDYGRVPGGNEIIVQGVHLEHVSAISLGVNRVDDFDIWSDSAIRLTVPAAPGLLSGAVDLELATAWAGETFLHVYRYWPRLCDMNGDNSVDLVDFALFEACLAGPSVTTPPDGCAQGVFENADLDGDGYVDLVDFSTFQLRFGRPE